MKKSLFLGTLLSVALLAGCTPITQNSTKCPEGSEYWESKYENGDVKAQGCFKIDSDEMEGHWIYYFENGGKDMEGDMENDLEQGEWVFYDENGNNIVVMKGHYKDGQDDGKWTYFDDEGNYICAETYSKGELVDEGDCVYNQEYEE